MYTKKDKLIRDTYDRLEMKATLKHHNGDYLAADFYERLATRIMKQYRGIK